MPFTIWKGHNNGKQNLIPVSDYFHVSGIISSCAICHPRPWLHQHHEPPCGSIHISKVLAYMTPYTLPTIYIMEVKQRLISKENTLQCARVLEHFCVFTHEVRSYAGGQSGQGLCYDGLVSPLLLGSWKLSVIVIVYLYLFLMHDFYF